MSTSILPVCCCRPQCPICLEGGLSSLSLTWDGIIGCGCINYPYWYNAGDDPAVALQSQSFVMTVPTGTWDLPLAETHSTECIYRPAVMPAVRDVIRFYSGTDCTGEEVTGACTRNLTYEIILRRVDIPPNPVYIQMDGLIQVTWLALEPVYPYRHLNYALDVFWGRQVMQASGYCFGGLNLPYELLNRYDQAEMCGSYMGWPISGVFGCNRGRAWVSPG